MGTAQDPQPAAAAGYAAEVRFGIVMYGGVSLAIYINGVANEMFELAAATPLDRPGAGPDSAATAAEETTRDVYRRLSRLVHDAEARRIYAQHLASATADTGRTGSDDAARVSAEPPANPDAQVRTRFVVDVIAGTSAGGINGIFLAKALANQQPFAPLRDLWVQEGDIAGLLNDKASWDDRDLDHVTDRTREPASLLNSDRMYCKLRRALREMSGAAPAPKPSPWVDELDLFVTTTDIRGSNVTLRLFDDVVTERRHRHVFRFRYRDDGVQVTQRDLAPDNDAFLAFAARCTSSFPFAFEPMTLASLKRLEPGLPAGAIEGWRSFFQTLSPDERAQAETRAFGDGGYLDNKPFGHAVEALAARSAVLPVERKLIYVEPAPEAPAQTTAGAPPPNAVTNALAALTSIPRYETIREDLEAVLRRNRRIERIDRIVRLGERDLDAGTDDPLARVMLDEGRVPAWRSLDTRRMREYYGDAFLPYYRLRQYTVTDDLADRLSRLWDLERDGDQVYALRALVRAWREARYRDPPEPRADGTLPAAEPAPNGEPPQTPNAFLVDFDLAYRERRTAFLLRKTDQLLRLFGRRRPGPLRDLAEADAALAGRLERRAKINLLDTSLAEADLADGIAALKRLRTDLIAAHRRLRGDRDTLPGDPAAAKRRGALHSELLGLLDLLLLRTADSGKAATRAAEGSVARGPRFVLTVADAAAGGGPTGIEVPFTDEELKLPNASRTLQEGVFLRAKALLDLARRYQATALEEALNDDMTAIQEHLQTLIAEPDADDAPGAPEPTAARLTWLRLGRPWLDKAWNGTGDPDEKNTVDWQVVVNVRDTGIAVLDTTVGRGLRRFLSEYYMRFDSYDQMSFPLHYDTDSGELATVEVVRISPQDAPRLIDERREGRRKLAGTALANFGAFLQRHWRTNDILWGRLDGAERLIAALLPGMDADSAVVREALIAQAHRIILREGFQADGQPKVTTLMVDALAELESQAAKRRSEAASGPKAWWAVLWRRARPDAPPPEPTAAERRQMLLDGLLERLAPGSPEARRRLERVLASLMDDEALRCWVRDHRDVDRQPEPKAVLENASRAVTITGRVLEEVLRGNGRESAALRWVTRSGLVAQAMLAVSVPGTLKTRLATHWLKLLYAFELTALGIGFALGSEPMRSAAITALALTGTVHLATLVLKDVITSKRGWIVRAAVGAAIAVAALAAIGVLALARVGPMALLNLG